MIGRVPNNDPRHVHDVSGCGAFLTVAMTLSNDQQYVSELDETLVDLSKGYAGMKVFAKDFWDKANAANQDKLSKDSEKKPAL